MAAQRRLRLPLRVGFGGTDLLTRLRMLGTALPDTLRGAPEPATMPWRRSPGHRHAPAGVVPLNDSVLEYSNVMGMV